MKRRAAAAAVLIALATAAPVEAATVTARHPTWYFTAAPGEANDVTVSMKGLLVHVRDAGAVLEAGSGCQPIEPHEVACDARESGSIKTGDGDDHVRVGAGIIDLGEGDDHLEGGRFDVDGGPGNDTVFGNAYDHMHWKGGSGDDVLRADPSGEPFEWESKIHGEDGADVVVGGNGPNVLVGGNGRDVLVGGPGSDILYDYSSDADAASGGDDDSFDGGAGVDTVTYAHRSTPLTVDLADPAADGASGEADRFAGVEDVVGGTGDDRLIGDDNGNRLVGGPGHDILVGKEGRDDLTGDAGFDRFDGGGGDDHFDARDIRRYYYYDIDRSSYSPNPDYLETDPGDEPMECGEGSDVIVGYMDSAAASCESTPLPNSWYRDPLFALRPDRVTGRRIAFWLPCVRGLWDRERCTGRVFMRSRRRTEAKDFSIRAPGRRVWLPRPYIDSPTRDRIGFRLRYRTGTGSRIDTYMTIDLPLLGG